MAVGRDVNIGSANKPGHFLRTDETVVEDYIGLHSHRLRQRQQAGPILVPLATQDVGVSCAGDNVHYVLVPGQNLRQGLNDVFDSLVRRQQAEREQHGFSFHAKTVFVEVGIQKRQVRNAVRYHVDLAARHFKDFLQELG